MSLVAQIVSGVAQAKSAMGDLVVSGILTRVTNTGFANLQPTQITETGTIQGFYGDWEEEDKKSFNVLSDDVKFYAFTGSLDPKVGDSILLDDINFQVVKDGPIKAGSTVVMTALQLRK